MLNLQMSKDSWAEYPSYLLILSSKPINKLLKLKMKSLWKPLKSQGNWTSYIEKHFVVCHCCLKDIIQPLKKFCVYLWYQSSVKRLSFLCPVLITAENLKILEISMIKSICWKIIPDLLLYVSTIPKHICKFELHRSFTILRYSLLSCLTGSLGINLKR